jgi:hypothetical protein
MLRSTHTISGIKQAGSPCKYSILFCMALVRIPAHRGHLFRLNVGGDSGTIVGSDSGSSWAPISVPRGHLERLVLEQSKAGRHYGLH